MDDELYNLDQSISIVDNIEAIFKKYYPIDYSMSILSEQSYKNKFLIKINNIYFKPVDKDGRIIFNYKDLYGIKVGKSILRSKFRNDLFIPIYKDYINKDWLYSRYKMVLSKKSKKSK